MPKINDTYKITLKPSHLGWGHYRHTNSRRKRKGEAYVHIPRNKAIKYNIYNSNNSKANVIYKCNSSDGFLKNVDIRASGSSKKGNVYAKQFQGSGNLKLFGFWFKHIKACVGDIVVVKFTSSTSFTIKLIRKNIPTPYNDIHKESGEE